MYEQDVASYKILLKTSRGEVILIVSGRGVFISRKDDLKNWKRKGSSPILNWNATDCCELDGFVYYLDISRTLCTLNIYTYEIEQLRLNF